MPNKALAASVSAEKHADSAKETNLVIKFLTPAVIEQMRIDNELFDKMATKNKPFIYEIVKRFSPRDLLTIDDYFVIGLAALWKAVHKFDPSKQTSFSTFSWKVIYNDILQAVNKQNKITAHEVSMEKFVRTYEHTDASEYSETAFKGKIVEQNHSFEDNIIQEITINNYMSEMENLHKKIFDLRIIKKMKHKDVAKALNLTFSTYKNIYYRSVQPKVKQLSKLLK